MTAKNFESENIDYFIAVEPQEADEYILALGKHRVLVLPFSILGLVVILLVIFVGNMQKVKGLNIIGFLMTILLDFINGKMGSEGLHQVLRAQ